MMKLKYMHHTDEWLPGEFEPPATFPHDEGAVWCVHPNVRRHLLALKMFEGGTGVWTTTGRLLHYIEKGTDLVWLRDCTEELLSLESRFGPCQSGKGIRHVLRRLESETFEMIDEMEVCVLSGFANYLVLNHRTNQCLATWLDPGVAWGYVIIALDKMHQLPGGLVYEEYPTLSPPAYSLDDRFIVSCNPIQDGWWADDIEDYERSPSAGGLHEVGVITVHDTASDTITNHQVVVDLPVGWMPDRPSAAEWSAIWGPEFVSEREFLFWLPDDSTERLTLPLPPTVTIHRPLKATRDWLEDDPC